MAYMPGAPTRHVAVNGPVHATSFDVHRWGCVFNLVYSDSLPGGLARAEVPTALAALAKGWGGTVTSESALPGWPDTAEEFEARGPDSLLVRGRIATQGTRIYTWYVGCPEDRWKAPWVRHYATRFIGTIRFTQ